MFNIFQICSTYPRYKAGDSNEYFDSSTGYSINLCHVITNFVSFKPATWNEGPREKSLAQKHNTMTPPSVKFRSLTPTFRTLSTKCSVFVLVPSPFKPSERPVYSCIIREDHKNKENDHQLKRLLIVEQILFVSTLGNV